MTTKLETWTKKPVSVEAMLLDGDADAQQAVLDWVRAGGGEAKPDAYAGGITITTLEGKMRASVGDYVIRGVRGEFYPCKPSIFAETYTQPEPEAPSPDREKLIAEAFPFDGSDPDTVIECRRRVSALLAALAVSPVVNEAVLAEVLRVAEVEYQDTMHDWTDEEGEPELPSAFRARRAVEHQHEWLGVAR